MKHLSLFLAILVAFAALTPLQSAQAAAQIDDLVMCADSSTVYYIGEDGKRHAFFNEKVFKSWYANFDGVKRIACTDLADLQLGQNVPYQAGTKLVKLVSSPIVYVVTPGGVLRPIASEEQAVTLYGEDWATRVDDMDDGFFSSFEVETELEDEELPKGLLLKDHDDIFLIGEDGVASEIDELLGDEEEFELYRSFALDREGLEVRINVEITSRSYDQVVLENLINNLLEQLQAINVVDEFEVEVEVEIEEEHLELEDEDADFSEASRKISRAGRLYEIAVDVVDAEEARGSDVTNAHEQLTDAENLLDAAVAALEIGEYGIAKEFAQEAEDVADDVIDSFEESERNDSDDSDETDDQDDDDKNDDDSDASESNSGSDQEEDHSGSDEDHAEDSDDDM